MSAFRRLFRNLIIVMAGSLSLAWLGCANPASNTPQAKAAGGRGQQVVPVAVATAERRDVPLHLSGLGTAAAFNTVTIKSRVDGQLVAVHFKEGQDVKKGDLLAVIDPRPLRVQLSQTQATLFKDESALKDAKANQERFQQLFKEGVIARQQLDTQLSMAGQLEGSVRADQAQVESAKLQLTYTRITAPLSGRVGLRLVDVGNMVHASDPNGLMVITQLDPISVLFTLPEDNLQTVAAHMKSGPLEVEALNRDDQTKLGTGKLVTIDNQIDTTTGTGRLKAVFDNHDHALWPNQFVNVRLLLEVRKGNIVVPAAAIQNGPQGSFVYAVKPDNTVDMRPVTVAFTESGVTAVSAGISPGDVVVTDGQDKLQAGSQVSLPGAASGGGNAARRGGVKGNTSGQQPAQSPVPPPAGRQPNSGAR